MSTVGDEAERGSTVGPGDGAQRSSTHPLGVPVAGRRADGGLSLSPGSVRAVEPPPELMVLPSPNGSTISAALAGSVPTVLAASLRNASAVAAWLAA